MQQLLNMTMQQNLGTLTKLFHWMKDLFWFTYSISWLQFPRSIAEYLCFIIGYLIIRIIIYYCYFFQQSHCCDFCSGFWLWQKLRPVWTSLSRLKASSLLSLLACYTPFINCEHIFKRWNLYLHTGCVCVSLWCYGLLKISHIFSVLFLCLLN